MIYLILILGFVLRLWNSNQSLWLDEAAQAVESKQPFWNIPSNLHGDFHPPLFHLVLHFWMYLGTSEWVMRMLPILFGIGSIYLIYLYGKEVNKNVGILSALFLAINPFHIYFSQELRPYMMSLFLILLMVWIFWLILIHKKKLWIIFTLTTVISFYTSYFTVFPLAGLFIYLVLRRRDLLVKFILSSFAVLILYLPWIPQIFAQLQISQGIIHDLPGWSSAVAVPGLKVFPLTWTKFIIGQINFNPRWLYGVIAGVLGLVWLGGIALGIKSKDKTSLFNLLLVGVGLIVPCLISFILPIAAPKRLIFNLPFLVILLSLGITTLPKVFKQFLIGVIILSSVGCLLIYEFNPSFQREDWRDAVATLNPAYPQIYKFTGPFAPVVWYSKSPIQTVKLTETLLIKPEDTQKLGNYLVDKDHLYLFHYLGDLTDPKNLLDQKIVQLGYKKVDTYDYPGVGLIDLYQK